MKKAKNTKNNKYLNTEKTGKHSCILIINYYHNYVLKCTFLLKIHLLETCHSFYSNIKWKWMLEEHVFICSSLCIMKYCNKDSTNAM